MIDYRNMDAWQLIAMLPDKSIDCILTDPPYDDIVNMDELRRVCRGNIIMFCAPMKAFFEPDFLLEWHKPAAPKNISGHIGQSNIEWIIVEHNLGMAYNDDLFWANYTGVFHDVLLTKPVHPFEKPVSLLERLIAIYTNPGDKILEPFAGSGATLKAARNLGRSVVASEISTEYYRLFEQCPQN
jgi:DNA modification methylase